MPGSEEEYRYWGERANTHDDDVLYIVGHTINQKIEGWLINQFKDTDVVLELGCGTGIFSEMIADRVERLIATDLAEEMIELAMEKLGQYGNVKVQVEDCYDTSFEDNTFDAVLLVNLIHIVKDPVAVLRESGRVLKNDGRIVIADYTGYEMPPSSQINLGVRYIEKFHSPAPYNRLLSPDELAEIAKEAGFAVEETKLIGEDTKAVCLRCRKARNGGGQYFRKEV